MVGKPCNMENDWCDVTLFATTLTTNIIMVLFKCRTCTFVMDSDVHGNHPCQMCGERIIKRLPLDHWDVVDAEQYNSLFPPVADFRAAIGRPTTHVRDEVIAKRLQPSSSHRIYVDLLPSSQAMVQGTSPMADTSAPATKKKVPFELGTIGGELLPCSCATCIFLAERRLTLKRAADAEEKKLEADISLAELKLKMKRAAVAEENKRAPVAKEKKKRSAKKRAADAAQKKRAADGEDKKRAAGADEKY